MKVLLCVLLMLVPGCAGILTGKPVEAPTVPVVAPLPVGWAYAMTIDFLDAPATAAAPVASEKSALPSNAVAGGVTIVSILRHMPLLGAFVFGADAARDIAKANGTSADTAANGPITDGVFKAAIASGRVKSIRWIPVKAEAVLEKKE